MHAANFISPESSAAELLVVDWPPLMDASGVPLPSLLPQGTQRAAKRIDEKTRPNKRGPAPQIQQKIEQLNQATLNLAENMMNTAVRGALKGTKI